MPKKQKISHEVRTNRPDGTGRVKISPYTRGMAIKIHCTECMGHETDPKDCTSPNYALFPFRKKTYAAYEKKPDGVPAEEQEQDEDEGEA